MPNLFWGLRLLRTHPPMAACWNVLVWSRHSNPGVRCKHIHLFFKTRGGTSNKRDSWIYLFTLIPLFPSFPTAIVWEPQRGLPENYPFPTSHTHESRPRLLLWWHFLYIACGIKTWTSKGMGKYIITHRYLFPGQQQRAATKAVSASWVLARSHCTVVAS